MRKTQSLMMSACLLAACLFVGAAEGEKPKKEIKVPKPWSELNLTDEQKASIVEINRQASMAIKAIKEKETQDIRALLTPEQVEALDLMKQRQEQEKKEKQAAEKARKLAEKNKPATQPAE